MTKLFTRSGLAVTALLFVVCTASSNTGSWSGWGGSYFNNRWASSTAISLSTIHSLHEHCKITYHVGVSAPPAILDNIAYYSTWNGSVVALDYKSCSVKWQINVTALIESFAPITSLQEKLTNPVSRSSPQIDTAQKILYFGTQTWSLIVAADLASGIILGIKQINPHPLAGITMSPTLYKGSLFVGVSSSEENAAFLVNTNETQYPCCSFIGNVVSLSFSRSKRKFTTNWDIPMIPPSALATNGTPTPPANWSGIGVWGSQPAIDAARNQVFFATGNVYTVPDEYLHCTEPTAPIDCIPPSIWQESVLALDIATGQPRWVQRLSPLDAWTLVCGVPSAIPRDPELCPHEPGPDSDFAMAPTFVPGTILQQQDPYGPGGGGDKPKKSKDLVTLGQKNGNLYALDASTGAIEWATMTSPGGAGGGLMWGVAADAQQVYFTAVNYAGLPWTLVPSNLTTHGAGYGAASLRNGTVVWSVAAPEGNVTQVPPTVVGGDGKHSNTGNGGLVLTGWTGPPPGGVPPVSPGPGGLLVFDRETGAEVLRYGFDGPFYGGVAVEGEFVFAGTGYKNYGGDGHFYVLTVGE